MLVAVIAAEIMIYLVATTSPGISSKLKNRGISVYPFAILIDLGKGPKFKSLSRARRAKVVVLAVGTANFAILLALFYWMLIPSIISLLRSLFVVPAEVTSPFVPVIPGITVSLHAFLYLLLAAAIGIALHEIFHALATYMEGLEVEAWGAGLLLIFPLAYVRIAEEHLAKLSLKSKVRILSAGILANTLLFLIAVACMQPVLAQINTAVVVVGLSEDQNAPAVRAGLPTPCILKLINDTSIRTINDLREVLSRYKYENVTLVLQIMCAEIADEVVKPISGIEYVRVFKESGRDKLGVYVTELPTADTPLYALHIGRFLYWLQIVNISLAMLNAAPLYITDGAKIISEILRKYNLEHINKIVQSLTVTFTVALLLIGLMKFM
ncbi:MAG: site-2 protease family protein [Desulfurococcales archaeon]|nr:site-2 protease family protein [Desulfurococcales archaeon]